MTEVLVTFCELKIRVKTVTHSTTKMAYVRTRDDEFASSAQCAFKGRLAREAASRSTEPSVFLFWVKEAGAKGPRKNILWMSVAERTAGGEFTIDAQGRIEFYYAGADGEVYTGRGYAQPQEQTEVARMTMIEGFDLFADVDCYHMPNEARKAAHVAMQSAFDAFQTGTPSPPLAAHIDCVCAHNEGGTSCGTSYKAELVGVIRPTGQLVGV